MRKILIGIPSAREDDKFYASVDSLVKQMKGKYEVSVLWEKWRDLTAAQNSITSYFLSSDFDFLLFLDDDQYGHTVEMVDAMVAANAYCVTMKTYIRHYPYPCGLMVQHPDLAALFVGVERDSGSQEIDMCGFPMTLLRRDLFEKLVAPYFQSRPSGERGWTTDELFCERLRGLGIRPIGIFDYCLDHGDITRENVMQRRQDDCKSSGERIRLKLLTGGMRLTVVDVGSRTKTYQDSESNEQNNTTNQVQSPEEANTVKE